MLRFENVSKTYISSAGVSVQAVREACFSIPKGQCSVIVGPSGSGKSTMLNMAAGIEVPDGGSVEYDGENLYRLNSSDLAEFRCRSIGLVFQNYQLIADLTVLENVILPYRILHKWTPASARKRAHDILNQLGMSERAGHFPTELSGGESQRTGIARALMNDPEILICDEPTGNLDSENGSVIAEYLKKLSKTDQKTVLIATHDDRISNIASVRYLMTDGCIQQKS